MYTCKSNAINTCILRWHNVAARAQIITHWWFYEQMNKKRKKNIKFIPLFFSYFRWLCCAIATRIESDCSRYPITYRHSKSTPLFASASMKSISFWILVQNQICQMFIISCFTCAILFFIDVIYISFETDAGRFYCSEKILINKWLPMACEMYSFYVVAFIFFFALVLLDGSLLLFPF